MLIAKEALYLQKTLSSKLFEVTYKAIFSSVELGGHGYQYNKHALIKLPIISKEWAIQALNTISDEEAINCVVYKLYGLTDDEIQFIESQ